LFVLFCFASWVKGTKGWGSLTYIILDACSNIINFWKLWLVLIMFLFIYFILFFGQCRCESGNDPYKVCILMTF
jgi:hypothetical protein